MTDFLLILILAQRVPWRHLYHQNWLRRNTVQYIRDLKSLDPKRH